MEFTLNDCISRINIALNYPSVAYEDIYPFLDQAIHELNTNLRIALPTLTEMNAENTTSLAAQPNFVNVYDAPLGPALVEGTLYGSTRFGYKYAPELGKFPFVKYENEVETRHLGLYGGKVSDGVVKYYATVILGNEAYWTDAEETIAEYNLTEYLPFEWWTLFVIPYVCSKWAVRNGDDSTHFVDEYVQGYQQLQTSYNIPNRVKLSSVAGRKAYKKLVEERLPNLNAIVFTRAIYEDMRVDSGIMPVYGGFYETGGWGI